MKAKVIRIGNSRGILIPKPILDQIGDVKEVDLEAGNGKILLRPAPTPRSGWNEAFRKMVETGDDKLLMPGG
jgi:antitoxin MazE